jgi:arsenite methyltransferase
LRAVAAREKSNNVHRVTRDLLHQDEIKSAVRQAYTEIPTGGGEAVTRRSYPAEDLDGMPSGAIEWALGVGNPILHAELRPGETVLDVGSGGGIDTILAARRVRPDGLVIGLDMLDEMCERARAHAREAGVDRWTDFRQGEMESIPLEDRSVDVVISNGVINLSPRKSRTLAEIYRVLRPGGRMCVVDLIVDQDLPPAVLGSSAAWAGCVSGALSERVFERKLQRLGFEDITVDTRVPFGLDAAALYPLFTPDLIAALRQLLPEERHAHVATSVVVRARRPVHGEENPRRVR